MFNAAPTRPSSPIPPNRGPHHSDYPEAHRRPLLEPRRRQAYDRREVLPRRSEVRLPRRRRSLARTAECGHQPHRPAVPPDPWILRSRRLPHDVERLAPDCERLLRRRVAWQPPQGVGSGRGLVEEGASLALVAVGAARRRRRQGESKTTTGCGGRIAAPFAFPRATDRASGRGRALPALTGVLHSEPFHHRSVAYNVRLSRHDLAPIPSPIAHDIA